MEFQPGKQVEVTQKIQKIADQFRGQEILDQFSNVHDHIFSQLTILPYDPNDTNIVSAEKLRRWKLTADQVLENGTIYDGKYCNDVVVVFNSIMKGLGHDAKVAKVFKKNDDGRILVHSLSVIKDKGKTYTVNAGSQKYWVEEKGFENGPVRDWVLWKLNVDQWAMNLTDSSQEEVIMNEAKEHYNLL